MEIVTVGLNHKSAPVEVREKLSLSAEQIQQTMEEMFSRLPSLKEKVILSTCNRVEIYARVTNSEDGIRDIKNFLAKYHELPENFLDKYVYSMTLEETVEHLFRVASSLDSMVVGEPQILGQVKDAYKLAKDYKATGMILSQLFERAFFVAKKIRTETRIAESAVSVSYAAVELARKIFADLEGKTVLLIGAGEMIELAAQHLVADGVKTLLVSNRTFERAVELAQRLKGNAIRFENIADEMERADIVISSTGSPTFVVKREMIESVMSKRHSKPMFLIDIAVPRDIDPAANDIENVFLYDIDDLQQVVDANMGERKKEAEKAEEIVKQEVRQFLKWMDSLDVVPTIKAMREKAEEIRQAELNKTLAKWGEISDKDRLAIDNLTSSIVGKLLHQPTQVLKSQAESRDGHWYVKIVRQMFGLD